MKPDSKSASQAKKQAWLKNQACFFCKSVEGSGCGLIHLVHFFAATLRNGIIRGHRLEGIALNTDIRFIVLLLRLGIFLGLTRTIAHNQSP
ncbi:MAG: hypothetical protein QME75_10425 [Deltaproteobacteria bacterium]|nr:hypothetical protein [Deltaproteobacteria bacterium]